MLADKVAFSARAASRAAVITPTCSVSALHWVSKSKNM